jgi:hypothetical protein
MVMDTLFANWRVTVFGLLSWAIPFVSAFPFFSGPGQLRIPQPLFKSLMVVIGGGVGVLLLVWVFRHVRPTLTSGFAIGVYWLAINWALDLLILLPMSGMGAVAYFYDIGLRYLLIPIVATAMGAVAQRPGSS